MISKSQLKRIQSLHQKKFRREEKLFLAEGIKAAVELLRQNPQLIKELYALKSFIEHYDELIKKAGVSAVELTVQDLERASALTEPNEVICICSFLPERPVFIDFASSFSLYLDDIRDPGNFGTIIRLADWFGIRQIFCSEKSCELYNPKVIQASMGSFMRVDVKYIGAKELIEHGNVTRVYGALLEGNDIYKEELAPGLIVVGNESKGISAGNLSLITHPLRIPSPAQSKAESLNAAMAASIITAEFFRQLRNH